MFFKHFSYLYDWFREVITTAESLRDLVVSLSLNINNFTRNIKSVNKLTPDDVLDGYPLMSRKGELPQEFPRSQASQVSATRSLKVI